MAFPSMVLLERSDDGLPETIKCLPKNYNFEIKKTLRTIKKLNAKKVTLQFPDGLLKYSLVIMDAIKLYTGADCVLLNEVVYGACCVDDKSITSDLLIHYGHSCLIPVTEMSTRTLYVFVDIKIDVLHLLELIQKNFTKSVALVGTIQFNSSINRLRRMLDSSGSRGQVVPQIHPLSPGEVLGCTSPRISNAEAVISVGDGRFHLESVMISNPGLDFYRYCPFSRKLTREFYDYEHMIKTRMEEIRKAFAGESFGIILGSLGRQGNKKILRNLQEKLKDYRQYLIILDEISQRSLERYEFIDSFVQISCPRLSIDWGSTYKKPLLSPFEVFYEGGHYRMDYYSKEGHAPWKNYNSTRDDGAH
jgi:2-(3-amino-3-carboxypropyl)histidine synthase